MLTSDQITKINEEEGRALLSVVSVGAPDFPIDKVFPFLAVFAVANTALINMLMASRLIYGMAVRTCFPVSSARSCRARKTPWAGIVFTTVLALGLIFYVQQDPESNVVVNLASVTSLLLLCVFAVVNVACLVLRGKRHDQRQDVLHLARPAAALGAVLCLFLVGPWVDRDADRLRDRRRHDADRRRPVGGHIRDQQGHGSG